jgi:hypothetical protein
MIYSQSSFVPFGPRAQDGTGTGGLNIISWA